MGGLSYKIVIYFDCLKKQIKELKLKDVYIISLIGNHEYTNLRGIYSECSQDDNSCMDYFTDPALRKDRKTFLTLVLAKIFFIMIPK